MNKKDIDFQMPMLERTLSLIELLSKNKNGLSISEIARILDAPKNSIFRITGTLYQYGYLNRDEKTKSFKLSRKFIDTGLSAIGNQDLIEDSIDIMREIRDTTKETTLLGIILGEEGLITNQLPSNQRIKLTAEVGMNFNLHSSAQGKAYLAFLPENERNDLIGKIDFKKYTEQTITSKSKLLRELSEIKEQGFAIDYEEEFEGVNCVGAAILDYKAYPIAVIWVTCPSYRFTEQNKAEMSKIVKEKAETISARYGNSETKKAALLIIEEQMKKNTIQ